MKVSICIDCSPTEIRRLLGQPDLFPLYEAAALALEDWLVGLVAGQAQALAPSGAEPKPRGGS